MDEADVEREGRIVLSRGTKGELVDHPRTAEKAIRAERSQDSIQENGAGVSRRKKIAHPVRGGWRVLGALSPPEADGRDSQSEMCGIGSNLGQRTRGYTE